MKSVEEAEGEKLQRFPDTVILNKVTFVCIIWKVLNGRKGRILETNINWATFLFQRDCLSIALEYN